MVLLRDALYVHRGGQGGRKGRKGVAVRQRWRRGHHPPEPATTNVQLHALCTLRMRLKRQRHCPTTTNAAAHAANMNPPTYLQLETLPTLKANASVRAWHPSSPQACLEPTKPTLPSHLP